MHGQLAGAAQGIGRCFAHTLGEAGAQIAIVDLNGGAAEATAQELRDKGIRAIAIQVCVLQAQCWDGVIARTRWLCKDLCSVPCVSCATNE